MMSDLAFLILPLALQLSAAGRCGQVISVTCSSASSAAMLLVRGPATYWRVAVPVQQRQLLGPSIENRYEGQMVCIDPTVLRRARGEVVTIQDAAQLTLQGPVADWEPVPANIARTCDAAVQLPVTVHRVTAHMTADAMRARIEGAVVVRGLVDRDGNVNDVRVLRPLEPSLDAEARRAFEQWTFYPARRAGEAVPIVITVEMTFTLRQ